LSRKTRSERDLWVDAVLDRVAEIARRFRAGVVSDQHMPGVVIDELRKRGLQNVRVVPWTATTRTEAFQALRARVATERIELVDDDQLVQELLRVRNRFRAGSSVVEVPRVGDSHGDLAIALAAAVHALDRHGVGGQITISTPHGVVRPPRFLREPLYGEHEGFGEPLVVRGEFARERLRRMRGLPETTELRPELHEHRP